MKRYEIERAVLAARLPGPEVTILMVLCSRINSRTGAIARQHQPSTRALARMTGYSRDTVRRHIRALETTGWLEVRRPPQWQAAAEHVTNEYHPLVPDEYPQAGPAGRPGLGRPAAQAGPAEHHGLGRHARRAGPAAPPELGRLAGRAGPAAGHNTEIKRDDRDPEINLAALTKTAVDEIGELTGRRLSPMEGREVVRLVLAGRSVTHPEAYLRRAIRADPRQYLPAAGNHPPPFSDLPRLQREAIARSEEEK